MRNPKLTAWNGAIDTAYQVGRARERELKESVAAQRALEQSFVTERASVRETGILASVVNDLPRLARTGLRAHLEACALEGIAESVSRVMCRSRNLPDPHPSGR